MYKNLTALDPSQHDTLRFDPNAGYAFAEDIPVCLLAPFEAAEAAKEYPVVFSSKLPCLPQVLLSAGQGRHPYISPSGKWLGRYIPAMLRTYPFILGALDEADNSEDFVLMADLDAPHFRTSQGVPLFDAHGAPGEQLQAKIQLLRKFLKGLQLIKAFLAPLREGSFFSDDPVLVRDKHDQGLELKGFATVRPQALASLDPRILSAMAQNGLLGLFYAHQHSMTNFGPILLASGGIISAAPASDLDLPRLA
ncbi:SapC family protein [Desulfonatronum parangueonense]